AGRTRTRSTATTPETRDAIAVTFSAAPTGAVSVNVSTVRRPSRQPATQMKSATTMAAAESAHGNPSATAPRPTNTAAEDHISEPKWSASASRASLDVSLATRYSTRARKKSTTIESEITPNAQFVTATAR